MTSPSIWLFLALFATPIIHAELLPRVKDYAGRARIFTVSGASASLGVSCLIAVPYLYSSSGIGRLTELPLGPLTLHFGLDALNAPLIPLLSLLTLALAVGSSNVFTSTRDLRALLWLESLTLITLCTQDLWFIALGFTLTLIPAYRLVTSGDDRILRRVYTLYHGIGLAGFLCAVGVLSYWIRLPAEPHNNIFQFNASAVPPALHPYLFGLITLAALIRMGVAPFHSWLPLSLERGSGYGVTLLVSVRTGFYIWTRVGLPTFPEAAHAFMPALTALALLSAVYGALAALGQKDLRRMVAFLVVSQSGIMLTGLCFGDPHAVSGTLLYWIGFAIATTGMMLMIACLHARFGSCDMRQCGGLVRKLPNLSGCFFLFGLATIAIPGTVSFVAEDLLVHGALEAHPLLTFIMLVAMVLNAVTFMRAFVTTFLGEAHDPKTDHGTLIDLLPRERLTAIALLLALIFAGVMPGPLVAAQSDAARAISFSE